jgi:hypothetical protein
MKVVLRHFVEVALRLDDEFLSRLDRRILPGADVFPAVGRATPAIIKIVRRISGELSRIVDAEGRCRDHHFSRRIGEENQGSSQRYNRYCRTKPNLVCLPATKIRSPLAHAGT